MSLREVLVGMIEEYARHMGHVDLLRERIDGRIGQDVRRVRESRPEGARQAYSWPVKASVASICLIGKWRHRVAGPTPARRSPASARSALRRRRPRGPRRGWPAGARPRP